MPPEDSNETPAAGDLRAWLDTQIGPIEEQLRILGRADSRWSLARLAMFFFAALAWLPLRENTLAALTLIAVGIGLFIGSIRRHRRVSLQHTRLKLRKMILDECLQRVGGSVLSIRSTARPADSPVVRDRQGQILPSGASWALSDQERDDLDLYCAPVGVFGLLNRTSTDLGAMRLRDMLEAPLLEADSILQRQQAVRWLAEHHTERNRLLGALAGLRGLDVQMPIFETAVESARPVLPAVLYWALAAWSGVGLAMAVHASALALLKEEYGATMRLGVLMAFNVLLWLPIWSRVRGALLRYQRSFEFACQYLMAARQGADDLPRDTQLAHLQRLCDAIRQPAALPATLPWIAWSTSGGFVQVLADLLVFYDVHMLAGIERHVVPRRESLLTGLAAVAELEAILSLACFAAEQPTVCWPEPTASMHLSIRRGRHPLIEPASAVPNDVTLAREPNLYIITGSNMSGKSTYLRMIGVNVLLAQMGSAAAAAHLAWSPLRLISDLRIRDNLGKGESYFLAEVRHLRRMIVPPPGQVPVLGLVDEPFRGTNHREQRAATLAIIEHLLGSPGLFLIATHDSTVTRLADGVRAQNHHFQEQLGPRELVFDYLLRPGPAHTRNAIRVLEREQYPLDLVQRALAHADAQRIDDTASQ